MRPECTAYEILDETTRSSTNSDREFNCDSLNPSSGKISPAWKGEGWYRFQDPAGVKLANKPPGRYHCGTNASGWSNSTLPDKPGDSVAIKICFDFSENNGEGLECWSPRDSKVTNCGSHFVYYLVNLPCSFRYCGGN